MKQIPPPIEKITSGKIRFSGKERFFLSNWKLTRLENVSGVSLACQPFVQPTPGTVSTEEKGKCFTGVRCYSQGRDGKVASVSLEIYAMVTSATADRSCARDDMNLYILQLQEMTFYLGL